MKNASRTRSRAELLRNSQPTPFEAVASVKATQTNRRKAKCFAPIRYCFVTAFFANSVRVQLRASARRRGRPLPRVRGELVGISWSGTVSALRNSEFSLNKPTASPGLTSA